MTSPTGDEVVVPAIGGAAVPAERIRVVLTGLLLLGDVTSAVDPATEVRISTAPEALARSRPLPRRTIHGY